jgi:hypothetical protein
VCYSHGQIVVETCRRSHNQGSAYLCELGLELEHVECACSSTEKLGGVRVVHPYLDYDWRPSVGRADQAGHDG